MIKRAGLLPITYWLCPCSRSAEVYCFVGRGWCVAVLELVGSTAP